MPLWDPVSVLTLAHQKLVEMASFENQSIPSCWVTKCLSCWMAAWMANVWLVKSTEFFTHENLKDTSFIPEGH